MDPGRWEQLKRLFASALEREPHERSAFMEEVCSGDQDLRAELESLIANYENTAPQSPGSTIEAFPDAMIGRRLGAYQIIRRHRHGGMATIYLAARADDQYHKCVAVKILNQIISSGEMLRRFRNERQTLAALDHQHIVKLIDAGVTDDGMPYLAMDYVEGLPIDEYCDAHRLSLRERLQLFRTVCQAVHYAHHNLVLHRDLKPGNILVTAEGTPKLLDFGIAKLLNPAFAAQTVITQTNMRPMTPEYASPEQVRGEPLTPSSDIYSLGVVLYELLTGHLPYRLKCQSATELEKVICDEEPERPSTAVTHAELSPFSTTRTHTPEEVCRSRNEQRPESLSRHLHGDLDNIVMMALRKEPHRRYASVEQFSEDIRRYLEGTSANFGVSRREIPPKE
jgi:serine/threonine protein kinase